MSELVITSRALPKGRGLYLLDIDSEGFYSLWGILWSLFNKGEKKHTIIDGCSHQLGTFAGLGEGENGAGVKSWKQPTG